MFLFRSILILTIYILAGIATGAFGQVKYEREARIKPSNIPPKAMMFIKPLGTELKIRWYEEESHLGRSYEAKTKIQGSLYSIEFDSSGQLMDIEKRLHTREVSDELSEKIRKAFEPIFDRYKILKIQEQYLTDELDLPNFLLSNPIFQFVECSVRGERQGEISDYEILLTASGEIVQILKDVGRSSDNLEF